MFKKGEILETEKDGKQFLCFTEDARLMRGSAGKYMGEVVMVCREYARADEKGRLLQCQGCRYRCLQRPMIIQYAGAFGEGAGRAAQDKAPQKAPEKGMRRAQDVAGADTFEENLRLGATVHEAVEAGAGKPGQAPGQDRPGPDCRQEAALIRHQAEIRISSPFIMHTIDGGSAFCGTVPVDYVLLEKVGGRELRQVIPELRQMEAEDQQAADWLRLQIIRQLLYGVRAYARQYAGLYQVHRDLKPENIMVQITEDDEVFLKIIDFDLMVRQHDIRKDELFLGGTPGYVHPEAYRISRLPENPDRQFSHTWDLYALGLIMYEIMEGHRHFEDDSYLEDTQAAWQLKEMKSGGRFPDLQKIIRRMIAPPEICYSDIDDVIGDYEAFMARTDDSDGKLSMWIDALLELQRDRAVSYGAAHVLCRVESGGLRTCYQIFTVPLGGVTKLTYGDNLIGFQSALGKAGREICGAFYNLSAQLFFMPLSEACRTDCVDLMAPGMTVSYKDVRLKVLSVDICREEATV